MSERITLKNVSDRLHNVNRRFAERGSDIVWVTQGRNGYIGLDRGRRSNGAILSTITCGTKREIADYLSAAMNALDDANRG